MTSFVLPVTYKGSCNIPSSHAKKLSPREAKCFIWGHMATISEKFSSAFLKLTQGVLWAGLGAGAPGNAYASRDQTQAAAILLQIISTEQERVVTLWVRRLYKIPVFLRSIYSVLGALLSLTD